MDSRNTSTAKRKTASAPAADEIILPPNDGRIFSLFDTDAMGEHDPLLQIAGRSLNTAFDVIIAVGAMAELIRGNRLEATLQYKAFGDDIEDALLSGIDCLSSMLNEKLCNAAEHINGDLNRSKGGV
jgi:hypothetical protein